MILGVIPARLNSTRFPNKIIFPLNGKPIIEHVYEKAIQSYKILSLKFPEKNSYFADQIKRIKKLK